MTAQAPSGHEGATEPRAMDDLQTRLHVLEAAMLALLRTHPDAAQLLVEFDRAIGRLDSFLDHAGRSAELQRLRQQAGRVRLQLEPD